MSHENKTNIFVVGMDEGNLDTLLRVPHAEEYAYHPLLTIEELQHGEPDIPELLRKARKELDSFDGKIDAIVGYWDFPVSTLVPVLNEEYGLRGTSLESIVKCEHKYWSRLEQREVIDEHPAFGLVDLEGEPRVPEGMRFPMWLKPVKSFSSELAYGVENEEEFREAVDNIRAGISRIGRPFEDIMDRLDLPPEIAEAGGQACLAEEALTGDQVAVEGFVHEGEVVVYGVLDSHTYPDSACFLRHQYPASLTPETVERIKDISVRVIRRIGLDNATFSIEYFHEPATGKIGLLEINPRHSQSHAEMFEHVDGVPNHHRMISLALGKNPRVNQGAGNYELGAKWYYRRFTDGIARRVPSGEEIARIEESIPGVKIHVIPEQGQRLSDMEGQDSYSFELAHLFVGADSEEAMQDKYDRCVEAMRFEFDEPEADSSAH
ncbi:acetyl-CoA carboxylase biotin carboxylase subunit family protein [uncultured Streptomyces sp.]|uniref:ATP-grasp domain-containing protein n=1 Tax=uncultured Streptomyces sp. TaxID=174707 RepID=UPI00262C81C6|nr:ATP-grasp domain-containing protein [uncultured Streptomyces sp.]